MDALIAVGMAWWLTVLGAVLIVVSVTVQHRWLGAALALSRLGLLVAVLGLAASLAGCGGGTTEGARARCPDPTPQQAIEAADGRKTNPPTPSRESAC